MIRYLPFTIPFWQIIWTLLATITTIILTSNIVHEIITEIVTPPVFNFVRASTIQTLTYLEITYEVCTKFEV